MATATRDDKGRFRKNGDTKNEAKGRSGGARNFSVIAGAATAGAALGVLAMLGRKVAVQAPTALAGDWAEALAAEHRAVLKLFDAMEATEERNTTRRTLLLAQMKHALAKHALEEENVIYPALREAGRKDGADELNSEHGYVKQYLYELENMPKDSAQFLTKLREFRSFIEEHMQEEENDLFPSLRAQLSEEKNKALTLAMNKEGFKLA